MRLHSLKHCRRLDSNEPYQKWISSIPFCSPKRGDQENTISNFYTAVQELQGNGQHLLRYEHTHTSTPHTTNTHIHIHHTHKHKHTHTQSHKKLAHKLTHQQAHIQTHTPLVVTRTSTASAARSPLAWDTKREVAPLKEKKRKINK